MKNVKFEILNENLGKEKYYALIKISCSGRTAYCILVDDDSLAVEGIGDEYSRAEEIYGALSCAEVSSIHLGDVIRDMQNEIFI